MTSIFALPTTTTRLGVLRPSPIDQVRSTCEAAQLSQSEEAPCRLARLPLSEIRSFHDPWHTAKSGLGKEVAEAREPNVTLPDVCMAVTLAAHRHCRIVGVDDG